MTDRTHSKKGKVDTYVGEQLVCKIKTGVFVWKGGIVRTSGTPGGTCDASAMTFDVTVSTATAKKLVANFVFEVVYDDSGTVLKFAGEQLTTLAA